MDSAYALSMDSAYAQSTELLSISEIHICNIENMNVKIGLI